MAHVSNIDKDTLPDDLMDVYDRFTTGYGPFGNQAAVLAHVPDALRYLPEMLMALKAAGNVPQRYIELAIIVVSRLNECTYCVNHHKPKLTVEGLSEDAVDGIMTPDAFPEYTEADKAVIAWAKKVEGDFHRVIPADIARLKEHFTESQVVELTLRASLCGFFNRFNDSLGIEDETLHHQDAAD